MLEFRKAAAANDLSELKRLWDVKGEDFNIDEPGPQSGKTAAHVAAERGHFETIYWLLEKGANFYCKDNEGKTAIDYLQQKELTSSDPEPMLKRSRQYFLCNAHYKIWLAHDPAIFMPYLYQNDFREYREKNPAGFLSLVYAKSLLNTSALLELSEFAEKNQISLISFENDLKTLIEQFGTATDKRCYQLASYELSKYSNQNGGNLAVVSDLIRWSSVLLRIGSYADTDVEIGQHKWTDSIPMEKSVALNLGSLIYDPNQTVPWLNGDIIAVSSLFPQSHQEGPFKITLSKAACCLIQNVQLSLISSCEYNMEKRIRAQQSALNTLSNLSSYLQDYFKACGTESKIIQTFSPNEIITIQTNGLESFYNEQRASIIERMANLKRRAVEEEFGSPKKAHKYSSVLKDVKSDEHEKFLVNYMRAIQMTNIKERVKQLTGIFVFSTPVWRCIGNDNWKMYSIYSNEAVKSAFRSRNTVQFDTLNSENERVLKKSKCADLSFTFFGMADVLRRSEALKAEHQKEKGPEITM
ncbi:putative glucosyltransferase Lgt1 [Legionella birminghamensis]|uniref:Glucosyltransferase Lgt1 n=2 Tax=Legionella birminghamensis TaxID=28083 RepID=A0A378IAU6_9GAMM|nr:putative glucosyltransferase Lgt1 [Legionella birminghamensis]STX32173.1 putative glucosyltransferase Lgt1 [Legionella birminghamensis]